MHFLGIVVMAKLFEQSVGLREGGDLLGGEDRREAFLPEVVRALDLAFGLRSGSVAQRNLVKAQGAAELGQGLWLTGEEEGMVVDVEGQREAVLAKGGWKEVEMSGEVFAFVNTRSRDQAAVVVDEAEEGGREFLIWEPAVRRSIILPELTDVLDLPAADWAARLFAGTARRQTMTQSPSADRGAMDDEVVTAENLGGCKAIRARRNGSQQLA